LETGKNVSDSKPMRRHEVGDVTSRGARLYSLASAFAVSVEIDCKGEENGEEATEN
jgi:hypothetical protein